MRSIIALIATSVALLSIVSCQGSKEDQVLAGMQERNANAARYRIVNLTGAVLKGFTGKASFADLDLGAATPMLKFGAGKKLDIECNSAGVKPLSLTEELPAKVKRTYYVVVENGALKAITIDNDPMEPNNGPLIRAVNLAGDGTTFKVSVDGKETDLGAPAAGTGASTSPSVSTGKLVATVTAGSDVLKTNEFPATDDNSFSVVAYKDATGKTKAALIVNHQKSLMSGAGASPTGG